MQLALHLAPSGDIGACGVRCLSAASASVALVATLRQALHSFPHRGDLEAIGDALDWTAARIPGRVALTAGDRAEDDAAVHRLACGGDDRVRVEWMPALLA